MAVRMHGYNYTQDSYCDGHNRQYQQSPLDNCIGDCLPESRGCIYVGCCSRHVPIELTRLGLQAL